MEAVILVGGKGNRLKPYTNILPKPLLPIGDDDDPIVGLTIKRMKKYGVENFFLLTNYKADTFKAILGNGSKYKVRIKYSEEKEPLGTAGPIQTLERKLKDDDFIVMNGDILTDLDFKKLLSFHRKQNSVVTVAMKKEKIQLLYGVVKTEGTRVIGWEEKPELETNVSIGIYAINSKIFSYMKKKEKIDMPDLIKRIINEGGKISGFLFDGHWTDVGRIEDYEKAAERELGQLNR